MVEGRGGEGQGGSGTGDGGRDTRHGARNTGRGGLSFGGGRMVSCEERACESMGRGRMGSVIDLHIHTVVGSMDSDISPRRLVEQAQAAGLTGVAVTEHLSLWPPEKVEELRRESGLFVVNAKEWSTDMGHIIVIGLDREVKNILRVQQLREAAQAQGAYMILAHPFRYFPGASNFLFGGNRNSEGLGIEELAQHSLFELVDAVEVLNGGCIARENDLALAVARHLGKAGTAGSDAHISSEIGRYATAFEREIGSEAELLAELWSGRFYPAQRSAGGDFLPLADAVREQESTG